MLQRITIQTSVILLFFLGFGVSPFDNASATGSDHPNIVFILVDDMGYGDPGCYNPKSRIATPNIDSLAKDGMLFTDAHAAGALCHISRYGLLTGRYPWRHQIRWNNNTAIEPGRMTIASLLKKNGYRTHMVGKWHLGFREDPEFKKELKGGPVDRGFDSFFGIRASTDIPPYFYIRNRHAVAPPTEKIEESHSPGWSPIQGKFWRAGGIAPGLDLADVLPTFTQKAIDVIRDHSRRARKSPRSSDPMFLYLAYPAPHTPWLPSPEFVGKSGAGMYGDFMMMVDDQIGKVLAELDRSGLAKETLVIFSSDNGPTWYDKDDKKFGHDSSGGLRGMKADAWEAGHRMPFLVRWPGIVPKGTRSDHLICFTDVFATFAEIVGDEIPTGQAPDSSSFLSVLTGNKTGAYAVRDSLVIAAGRGHVMVRSENWKLITGPGSGGFSPSPRKPGPGIPKAQLYDLKKDLAESSNLYEARPEKVRELTQLLEKIRSSEPALN